MSQNNTPTATNQVISTTTESWAAFASGRFSLTDALRVTAADLTAGTLPAARFDDAAHGARAGGALHAAATGAVAGFMAAADKAKLDASAGRTPGIRRSP